MYFTTTTFLTLIASIPMILGSPILETRQSGTICQTSNGSPETKDVTDVINQLRGQGGLCPQINPGNSGRSPPSLSPLPPKEIPEETHYPIPPFLPDTANTSLSQTAQPSSPTTAPPSPSAAASKTNSQAADPARTSPKTPWRSSTSATTRGRRCVRGGRSSSIRGCGWKLLIARRLEGCLVGFVGVEGRMERIGRVP